MADVKAEQGRLWLQLQECTIREKDSAIEKALMELGQVSERTGSPISKHSVPSAGSNRPGSRHSWQSRASERTSPSIANMAAAQAHVEATVARTCTSFNKKDMTVNLEKVRLESKRVKLEVGLETELDAVRLEREAASAEAVQTSWSPP